MRVEVTRRGGLAGVALSGAADTAQMPAEQGQAAESALRGLSARPNAAEPPHPDGFQYEIQAEGQSLVLNEAEIGDDLRPLIDDAMRGATLS